MRLQSKKTRRTRHALAMCLALFTLLSACGGRAATPQNSQNATGAQPGSAAQNAAEPAPAQGGALHMLEAQSYGYWGNNSERIYLPLVQENLVVVASSISFSDGVQRVVCPIGGCDHNSEACGGYLYTQGETSVPQTLFWATDTQLLYAVTGSFNQSGPDYLDVSAPDGTGRCRLELVPRDDPENYMASYHGVCANDTHFYYLLSRPDNSTELISTDLATGEQSILATWENTSSSWLVDCEGDSMVIQHYGIPQEPESPPTDTTDEAVWKAYKEAVDNAGLQTETRLTLVNTRGEETKLTSWQSGTLDTFAVYDMVRYAVRGDDGAITAYDLRTGEERVLATEIPHMKTVYLSGIYAGNLLVDPATPDVDVAKDDFRRYAVDLQTGAVRQLTTKIMKESSARPLFILGGNDDRLLVIMERRYGTTVSPGTDGTPYEHPTVENICATIPTQDYLADTPNFTEVTFLPGGKIF